MNELMVKLENEKSSLLRRCDKIVHCIGSNETDD